MSTHKHTFHFFNETKEQLEMLWIEDPKFPNEPHYLVIHTQIFESREDGEGKTWLKGTLSMRAEYFFGPLQREIGSLVSNMGGEIYSDDKVRLSRGEVIIRIAALRELGLGGFLFNRVVRWVKHANPLSIVTPLYLSRTDGADPLNRERRNRLYRRFGIRLNFNCPDEIDGYSASDMKVQELIDFPHQAWPNIHPSSWRVGWKEFSRAYKDARRNFLMERRHARVYKNAANKREQLIQLFTAYLRSVVSWPLAIFSGVLGYWFGSVRASQDVLSLLGWLGW